MGLLVPSLLPRGSSSHSLWRLLWRSSLLWLRWSSSSHSLWRLLWLRWSSSSPSLWRLLWRSSLPLLRSSSSSSLQGL